MIDWSKAPVWANWLATDVNGDQYWFASKPFVVPGRTYWKSGDAAFKLRRSRKSYAENWQESLRQRPNNV